MFDSDRHKRSFYIDALTSLSMFVLTRKTVSQILLSKCRKPTISNQKQFLSMSTPPKMAKLSPTIGTHNATFHCDDVTACYMLKTLDRFRDHYIVRTRDPELLNKAEIIVDVGGELDIERLRLDHHQRSFNQTIKDYHPKLKTTNPDKPPRLSSAGLVFALFGKDYIVKILNLGNAYKDVEGDADKKKMIDALFDKAYVEFMEEIDAIDNGVEVVDGKDVKYNYHIKSGISNRVGRFNPVGNATDEERLEQFKKAMEMVGREMAEGIEFLGKVWWPKRQQFRDCVIKRKEFDPSGQVVFIATDYLVGWKSAIYDLEEELGIVGEIKYVVYTDEKQSVWRVTGVPTELNSFQTRAPLKQEWCGKRDEDLQNVSGVPDATFVHMNGFTGGAGSCDGVKALIYKSLGLDKNGN